VSRFDTSSGAAARARRAPALLLLLAAAGACSGKSATRDADVKRDARSAAAERFDAATTSSAEGEPAFPSDVRSLELKRSTSVRMSPGVGAKRLGIVAAYTRVAHGHVEAGDGCEGRWVSVSPRGWVCEEHLRGSQKRPHGVEIPKLERGELLPGVYGKVITEGAMTYLLKKDVLVEARELAGSVNVLMHGERTVDEEVYWHIGDREYLPLASLRVHQPSTWHGVRLGDETGLTLPIGFAANKKNLSHRVPAYGRAVRGGVVRRLAARSALPVLEIARDSDGDPIAYRVGKRAWVPERDMRYVAKAEPPALTGPNERWIDVDLYRQVLVAYEGARPVYATLISSGSGKHPTATGIYRMRVKFAETDMSGQMADDAPYSVATVPWTQYFARDLALHTAYWHDKFGTRRSHGCINLSPIDSRFLYFWSDPDVPAGWSMSHGVRERPGSIVRIRSRDDPDPEPVGYAKLVYEDRKRKAASGRSRP